MVEFSLGLIGKSVTLSRQPPTDETFKWRRVGRHLCLRCLDGALRACFYCISMLNLSQNKLQECFYSFLFVDRFNQVDSPVID